MRADLLIKVSLTVLSSCALFAHSSSGYNTYNTPPTDNRKHPSQLRLWHKYAHGASAMRKSPNDLYHNNNYHHSDSLSNLRLRHQSRFPNLDRVMTRLDHQKGVVNSNRGRQLPSHHSMARTSTPPTTTTKKTTTTTERDLFEDYGDLIDEEETEGTGEYEDEWEDDDNDDSEKDEYEDDEMSEEEEDAMFNNNQDEWQAEEATEPPIQQVARSQPISAMSKYKWDNYGTRAKVEESRRQQLHLKQTNEQSNTTAVVLHYMKVKREGECRRPQLKVLPVQSEYPDPSKTYTPHCTVLHRCSEDTGCCPNHQTRCGPKTQVPVHLYFYAKTLGVDETKVERLMFFNHTECECIPKSKQNDVPNSSPESSAGMSPELKMLSRYPPENISKCKCPQEFTPKYRYTSQCSCDCEQDNQDCLRMKKGKEYIGMSDRMCILNRQCGVPLCEFGVYLPQKGRCQQKQETNLET